ncbi:MAG: CDP-alcohol phosphatidyltransferase family protein [Actinobacteria bacterium]|nr:CDP-alcohol phosphatidyltransferase family protein [Actinomycetota bacterium]
MSGTEVETASGSDPRRILTIPNALSLLRLSTVPFFVWLFTSGHEETAVIVYGAGAWTDFFDGWIARRTDCVTELGKLLDPLADRIFIIALAVALVERGSLPLWLALVIVVRDVLLLTAFPLLEKRAVPRVRVNFTGKTATASLLFGLTCLAWSETSFTGAGVGEWLGMTFVGVGAVLYWTAAAMYARQAYDGLRVSPGMVP